MTGNLFDRHWAEYVGSIAASDGNDPCTSNCDINRNYIDNANDMNIFLMINVKLRVDVH